MEMRTSDVEAVMAALDELEMAWDKLATLPVRALGPGQTLDVLDRLETHRRRQPAAENALLVHLQSQAIPKDLGAKSWRAVLSQRLGVSGFDAGRRLAEAAALGPRRAVTGEPLEPQLPGTAAAQARGEIGTEHVTVIRDFIEHLPTEVDPATRSAAESQLAGLAGGLTPEGLRTVARQLMGYLDQDGTLDDEREHARKRGLRIGRQEIDGMSRITGWIDPELRATLDAIVAKLAAPGYCNPDDDEPCVDGVPSQDQITSDTRSAPQRTHDALKTVCRAMLSSGNLGQHNGLSVTVVATTTLSELTAAAGRAHTGGGTQLPIPTLIRMAANAHPYLAVFRSAREIQLYYGRTRRTASPGSVLSCQLWNGDAQNRAAPLHPTAARSTTPNATGGTAATPMSTNSRWPADAITASSTRPRPAGPRENARATTGRNGFPHHTWIEARAGSISTTTRRRCCGPTTTRDSP